MTSDEIKQLHEYLTYDSKTGVFTWKIARGRCAQGQVAGCDEKNGYRKILINSRSQFAHRVAWAMHYGEWPDMHLDHINGNRSDNRIANLRKCLDWQNAGNSTRKSRGRDIPGVRKLERGGFSAELSCKRKKYRLGEYQSEADAAHAYELASILLYKEFSPYFPTAQRAAQAAQGGE